MPSTNWWAKYRSRLSLDYREGTQAITQFDVNGRERLGAKVDRGTGKGIALALAEAVADVAVTGFTYTWAVDGVTSVKQPLTVNPLGNLPRT